MNQLIISCIPSYLRVAYVENGELLDFFIEKESELETVGNIYKGKIVNVLDGMHCAFVDIGLEKDGFLSLDKNIIKNGESIMCQVTKESYGTKGVRLTTEISIPGKYIVLIPNSDYVGISRKIKDIKRREYLEKFAKDKLGNGFGIIFRSASINVKDEYLVKEIEDIKAIWKEIERNYNYSAEKKLIYKDNSLIKRVIRNTESFNIDQYIVDNKEYVDLLINEGIEKNKILYHNKDTIIFKEYKINKQIDNLLEKRVDVDNGGYIIIEPTEALTVIDVNTGKFVGDTNPEQMIYEMNESAAKTVAKEIRKRNVGGIIVVDFIDMIDDNQKNDLLAILNEELKKDIVKTTPAQITSLGLVEFTRERIRKGIRDYMIMNDYNIVKIRDKIIDSAQRNSGYPIIMIEANNFIIESLNTTKYIDKVAILQNKQIYTCINNDIKDTDVLISFYLSLDQLKEGAILYQK